MIYFCLYMQEIKKAVGQDGENVYIDLFVTPESDKTVFPAGYNKWRKKIEMKVQSPAKKNKANLEVIRTLSNFFDKKSSDVFILSGEKKKSKKVLIREISPDLVIGKIGDFIDGS